MADFVQLGGIWMPAPASAGVGLSPVGQTIVTDTRTGEQLVYDDLVCCHGGHYFRVKRGRQAYCPHCDARTCGSPGCDQHDHQRHPAAEWLRVHRRERPE